MSGMFGISRDSYDENDNRQVLIDPSNWIIHKATPVGNFLLVDIEYPECKNYEGRKILVYLNVTEIQLREQKKIDPHFSDNQRFFSPVARFEPTARGWQMAKGFCQMESTFQQVESNVIYNHKNSGTIEK